MADKTDCLDTFGLFLTISYSIYFCNEARIDPEALPDVIERFRLGLDWRKTIATAGPATCPPSPEIIGRVMRALIVVTIESKDFRALDELLVTVADCLCLPTKVDGRHVARPAAAAVSAF